MGKTSGSMAQLPVVNLGTGRTATAIATGNYHTCALLDNASVKCWGKNSDGQLGIDNTTRMGRTTGSMALLPVVNLGTGRTATAISAGKYHTCALLDNASVKCWGDNGNGQLGIDNYTDMGKTSGSMAQLPVVNLGTGRTATALAAGSQFSCAIIDNASVKCWGKNDKGQLGIDNDTRMGGTTGSMALLPVVNLGTGRTATAISAGGSHMCALLDNASVKCWGSGNVGQLGLDNGSSSYQGDESGSMASLPGINLGTGRTATVIAAGTYHTCALLDNASVKCWGYNANGRLGIDNTTDMGDHSGEVAQLTGINLGTGRTATALAGGNSHTCAVLDNTSVKCWGLNNRGQLGIDNDTNMGDHSGEMDLLLGIDL
jgi:alpha-tubulin suppressor-like RCC1 family protein